VAAVWRVVQTCLADSGLFQQGLPLVLVAARIDRLAGWLGEHPAALMPFGASMFALVVLSLAMFGDQDEQLVG
jgi:hypothetical protein